MEVIHKRVAGGVHRMKHAFDAPMMAGMIAP
jgi:hypothetical protein